MGKKSQQVGNDFTRVMARFLRATGCVVWPWDDLQIPATRRPADLQMCWNGRSVLVECKSTKANALPFSAIADLRYYNDTDPNPKNNQRKTLHRHARSGGLSIVAIQHRMANRSRVFLVTFQRFEYLRKSLDRASLPLADGKRPPTLIEIEGFCMERGFSTEQAQFCLDMAHNEALIHPLFDYRFQ